MMLSVDTSDAVNFKRLSKGRTSMPRLRIVRETDDKHVVNLGDPGIVHAKSHVKKFAARRLGKDEYFDRTVTGKTFIDNVFTDNNGVNSVVDPSEAYSVVDESGLYLKSTDMVFFSITHEGQCFQSVFAFLYYNKQRTFCMRTYT